MNIASLVYFIECTHRLQYVNYNTQITQIIFDSTATPGQMVACKPNLAHKPFMDGLWSVSKCTETQGSSIYVPWASVSELFLALHGPPGNILTPGIDDTNKPCF